MSPAQRAAANIAKLPELCYAESLEDGETVVLKRGEQGYYPTGYGRQGKAVVESLNGRLGVSKQQAAAMIHGSVAGFETPGADVDRYTDEGKPLTAQRVA